MDRVEILPKTWFRPRKAVIQGGLQLIFVHTRRHPRVHYGSPTFVGSPTDWARNQYSAGPKLVPVLPLLTGLESSKGWSVLKASAIRLEAPYFLEASYFRQFSPLLSSESRCYCSLANSN